MDPSKQFSKKLAKWTSWFWGVYMAWLSVIMIIQPSASQYAVYMALIATAVMILNVASYTRNSIYEKTLLAMLDKTRLSLNYGKGEGSDTGSSDDEDGDNG